MSLTKLLDKLKEDFDPSSEGDLLLLKQVFFDIQHDFDINKRKMVEWKLHELIVKEYQRRKQCKLKEG